MKCLLDHHHVLKCEQDNFLILNYIKTFELRSLALLLFSAYLEIICLVLEIF